MDDGLGPIDIEFIINNPEILAQADAVEAALIGVSDNVQQQAAAATQAITQQVTQSANIEFASRERLKIQLAQYKTLADLAMGTDRLVLYNQKVEEIEATLARMGNAGKVGFDEMGNAIAKVQPAIQEVAPALEDVTQKTGKFQAAIAKATDVSSIGARMVTMFTRQIVGLAVGFLSLEIGAKAIKSLIDYIAALDIFNPVAKEAEMRSKALTDALSSADYTKAVSGIEQLSVNLDLAKNGFIDKDKVVDEYNNTIGKVAGNVDTLNQAEAGYIKNADKFIKATLLKSAAQIILNDSAKDAAETAIKNQKIQDDIDAARNYTLTNRLGEPIYLKGNTTKLEDEDRRMRMANDQKEIDANNARLKQGYDRRLDIIKNFDKEQAALNMQMGGDATDWGTGEGVTQIQSLKTKLANDALETDKINAQTTLANDKNSYAARLKAVYDFYNASKSIAENNERLALSDKKLSADQKLHIENEYNNNVLTLKKTRDSQIQSLNKKENAADSILASQTSLQEKIQALKSEYQSKDETRDQQEIDAVKAKYQVIYNDIIAQNKKYEDYIKTHSIRDVAKSGLVYIDPKSVKQDETSAEAAVSGKQELEKTKDQINEEKTLFADYEAFKLKAGTDSANKLYGAQLKGYTTYIDYLKSLQPTEAQLTSANPKVKAAASTLQDYLKTALPSAETALNSQNIKQLEQYIADTQSFEDRRKQVIEKTNDEVNALTVSANATTDETIKADYAKRIELAKQQGEAQVDQLINQQQATIESYKGLGASIETLTTEQANLRIKEAKATAEADYTSGKISVAVYKEIIAIIEQAAATVKANSIAGAFGELATAMDTISQASAGLDQNLTSTLNTLGSMFKQVQTLVSDIPKLTKAINDYQKTKTDAGGGFLGTVSAVASVIPIAGAVISAAVSVVTGVINFFKAAHATAVQAAAQILAYQNSLITGQVKYNELLRDQERTQADITKMTLQQLEAQQQALALQAQQAQADYTTLMNLIESQGQQITGEHTTKYGGFLGIAEKTKVVQDLAGLSDTDYDQLQQLDTEGKLTDTTKAWFEQLQTVKQEMTDIGTSAADVLAAINQAATGTTADAITSAIIQGFQNGKRSAADFADDFNQMMNNALLSAFESNVLQGQIAAFYQQFADASNSDGGLTPDKIAQLKAQYATIISNTATEVGQIEKITGTSVTTGSGSTNTLQGAISGMTEQQADLLVGQFGGLRLTQIETNQILTVNMASSLSEMKNQTLVQMQIQVNTKRTADNTDQMKGDLKIIASNTSSSNLTNALRAAGK